MNDSAHRRIETNGVTLNVHEAGPKNGAPVVLCHGWPELAHSWRRQIDALAEAGYRVIAPDQRGFGDSDAPEPVEAYDIAHLSGDLVGLLDALEIEKAVFVGHDWGGLVVWPTSLLHPDRVAGVIGVCTPHLARQPAAPTEMLRKRFTPDHYMLRFQEEGVPEALFEGNEQRFFEFIFRKPAPRAAWPALIPGVYEMTRHFPAFKGANDSELVLSREDLSVYVETYRRSGFRGGINWYRNLDRNWRLMEGVDDTVRIPALMISADLDLFIPPEISAGMEERVPDLERCTIPGCGHWVSWEAPDALNAAMLDWLGRRFS